MQTTPAGQVDARTLLAGDLRRLAELHPGSPVLSLYVNLEPTEFGTQRARRSAYTSAIDEAARVVDAHDTDHAGRASLRADVERAKSFFGGYRPQGGCGVALFASSAAGVFEAYTLPRPTRTRVVVDDSPYVAPLVRAADVRDWLIVAVDTRHARFLRGNGDHVTELEPVSDTVLGQHESQGTTNHQRSVEAEVDQHLRRAAERADELQRDNGFDGVIVGGPPEIVPRFESLLTPAVRDRLEGRFAVDVTDTTTDTVRAAARPCFEEHERARERALLDRLSDRLGMRERAAAGADEVRQMLVQQRVETLLFEDRYEPPDAATLESMVEHAVAQSAQVLPVRHFPDELATRGHVAALLRF